MLGIFRRHSGRRGAAIRNPGAASTALITPGFRVRDFVAPRNDNEAFRLRLHIRHRLSSPQLIEARMMNEGGRSAAKRKLRPCVASRFREPHALQRSVSASSTAPGRAFREAPKKKTLLRQPCSRQASLVSPGGAPKPLLNMPCDSTRRSAASRSAYTTPREAPLRRAGIVGLYSLNEARGCPTPPERRGFLFWAAAPSSGIGGNDVVFKPLSGFVATLASRSLRLKCECARIAELAFVLLFIFRGRYDERGTRKRS
jgi:hypothetical protein